MSGYQYRGPKPVPLTPGQRRDADDRARAAAREQAGSLRALRPEVPARQPAPAPALPSGERCERCTYRLDAPGHRSSCGEASGDG